MILIVFIDVIEEGVFFVCDDREKFKEGFVGKVYEKKLNVFIFVCIILILVFLVWMVLFKIFKLVNFLLNDLKFLIMIKKFFWN